MEVKKLSNTNKRDSRFELLRIIAILMVLGLHYLNGGMGGALSNISKDSSNFYIAHFIESAFIIAVNVFVMISGYFLINKTKVSIKKVYNLLAICLFYGIIIFLCVLLKGKVELNKASIKLFIETVINRWFIVIYIILYLLFPYINKLVKNITQKQLKCLIGIMLFFFSIWPTIFSKLGISILTVRDNGYGIINFVILYLIGGYIKLYKEDTKSLFKSFIIYLLMTVITTIFSTNYSFAWSYNSVFNIISATALFVFFKSINIQSNVINKLAKHTLSVYIIHGNEFIVKYIYQSIFKTTEYYNSIWLPLHLIITIILIYIGCIMIDIVRSFIFKYTVDKFFNLKCIDKDYEI